MGGVPSCEGTSTGRPHKIFQYCIANPIRDAEVESTLDELRRRKLASRQLLYLNMHPEVVVYRKRDTVMAAEELWLWSRVHDSWSSKSVSFLDELRKARTMLCWRNLAIRRSSWSPLLLPPSGQPHIQPHLHPLWAAAIQVPVWCPWWAGDEVAIHATGLARAQKCRELSERMIQPQSETSKNEDDTLEHV